MSRRRRHLEVSTFPFLAVLLCTMGSLILLLLVIDRRAKIVALLKAKTEHELIQSENSRQAGQRLQLQAEHDRVAEEKRLEWEQRSQQLHAFLADQEQEIAGQIRQANEQLAAASAKLRTEQAQVEQEKKQLEQVRSRFFANQQKVKAQHEIAAKAERLSTAARRELERQTAELQQLEQTLASLKALRERQKNTYSLVPYLGRRGDNRKPIYVECAGGGVIFHPDRVAVDGMQMTGGNLRAEVEKRIARQREQTGQLPDKESQRPYLLMLVRPDGINTYYRTQEALAGMQLDFGYEFIEPDWVLDFTAEGNDAAAQSWMKAAILPSQIPTNQSAQTRIKDTGSSPAITLGGSGVTGTVGVGKAGGSSDGNGRAAGTTGGSGMGATSPGGGGNAAFGIPALGQTERGPAGGTLAAIGNGGTPGTGSGGFGSSSNAGGGVSPQGDRTMGLGAPASFGAVSNVTGSGGATAGLGTGSGGSPAPFGNSGQGGVNGNSQSGANGNGQNAAAGNGQPGSPGSNSAGPSSFKNMSGKSSGGSQPGANGGGAPVNGEMKSSTGRGGADGNPGSANNTKATGENGITSGASGTPQLGEGVASGSGGGHGGTSWQSSPPLGSGGSEEGSGGFGSGAPAMLGQPTNAKSKTNSPPPLGRILGNRDWLVYIECNADGVVVKQGSQKFSLDSLALPNKGEHPLVQAVRLMISRRQATVRDGEPPYKPQLRFQIQPDGLRAYYLAYPLLDALRLPMMRENVERPVTDLRGPKVSGKY